MNMPLTWPDGTLRSTGNPFAAAYLPKIVGATAYPAKRGPKPPALTGKPVAK